MTQAAQTPNSEFRLGWHHFAHLRAVAQGIPVADSARQFLAIEHGSAAATAHRLVVARVAAVARRRGDSRWRLVGIEIRAAASEPVESPPLYEWADSEGLDGWSEAELQALYVERFGAGEPRMRRRLERNARLIKRRLALLRELEAIAAERAAPTDLFAGWLTDEVSEQLKRGGDLTLGDLQRRIARGGRWWSGLRSYGPVKASRLAGFVRLLLEGEGRADSGATWALAEIDRKLASFDGRRGLNRATGTFAGTAAQDDRQAIEAWVAARATPPTSKKQYTREAERFMLWCVLERSKALADATAEDCQAYMKFLAEVPDAWVSRRNVGRMQNGWAPFRGALTIASQTMAIRVLQSLFSWLVQARYLASNPWVLVNRKLGDDPDRSDDASRAFAPKAWAALLAFLKVAEPSASKERLAWLCTFVECTGLRAAELLRATKGHLVPTPAGWVLRVHGKGRKNRTVPVPAVGIAATRSYFAARGIEFQTAAPTTPLLASLIGCNAPITYSALHQTFTRFVRHAIDSSNLTADERRQAQRASTHWLRHTHATRAAEREVPPDVLQENLGQSDPRTTARYYRAQLERRQSAMERAFALE